MWKLVQSGLSVVAGTAEPEYGPDSIHPVGYNLGADEEVFNELSHDDLKFVNPGHTNVETQTFYFQDATYSGFAQIIHSNVIGLHTTAQFTFKIFNKETPDKFTWTSTKLENFSIQENGTDFKADNLSIVLNKEDNTYQIDSTVNKLSEVHLTVQRIGNGIKFGTDGVTLYGTDIENPWGSMRHVFWPRCNIKGDIVIRELKSGQESIENEEDLEYIDINNISITDGLSMYVMALQGMKPHHAAATWDFLNYQSDKYSVVLMEFTTPPSYNKTKVSVSMVVDQNGEIVLGALNNETKHLENKVDETSGWNVPTKISYNMSNNSKTVQVTGDLKNLSERVDVMAEIPQFVKNIVSGVAGTKPYIYQFSNLMHLTIKDNESNETLVDEDGYAYSESTFITAL